MAQGLSLNLQENIEDGLDQLGNKGLARTCKLRSKDSSNPDELALTVGVFKDMIESSIAPGHEPVIQKDPID